MRSCCSYTVLNKLPHLLLRYQFNWIKSMDNPKHCDAICGKVVKMPKQTWTNVLLRIRTVIGQQTLQAEVIQTPEELCQAAPNPSPLGPLRLLFPGDFSQVLHPHRQHSHGWRRATVLLDNELIPPVDTSAYSSTFTLQAPISFCCWPFNDLACIPSHL